MHGNIQIMTENVKTYISLFNSTGIFLLLVSINLDKMK